MSSYTLFISDLHLQASQPEITNTFLDFLKKQAAQADALYILGDFFDRWIGDDHQTRFNMPIMAATRQLSKTGVPIYFMSGNRDFLIGKAFTQAAGMTLLKDPHVISLYGKPTLLMHGDSLCTLDTKHQAYRKKVLNPWIQKIFLSLPLRWRLKISEHLRQKSYHRGNIIEEQIRDVTPKAVYNAMEAHQVSLLIHGHTHRPGIHELLVDKKPAKRIVLGDWQQQASVLVYLRNGGCRLQGLS